MMIASLSGTHDAARGVTERLDRCIAGIEDRQHAAWARFETLIAPGKGADDAALAEHDLEIAAEILGVQQAFLERVIVERKYVLPDFAPGALVHVFEGAEIIRRRFAFCFLELAGDVGAHMANRGIHRMVA